MKIENSPIRTIGLAILLTFSTLHINAQFFEKGTKLVDAGVEFTNGIGAPSVVPVTEILN